LKTAAGSAITRPLAARLKKGCRGGDTRSIPSTLPEPLRFQAFPAVAVRPQARRQESKMPKL